jgi:hypothetical protein
MLVRSIACIMLSIGCGSCRFRGLMNECDFTNRGAEYVR